MNKKERKIKETDYEVCRWCGDEPRQCECEHGCIEDIECEHVEEAGLVMKSAWEKAQKILNK